MKLLEEPKSQVVVLTLLPEAEENGISYAKVLTEAKSKVDLGKLGISSLGFRKAATGGRILELPGADNKEKADSLAAKLREVLGDGVVRINRPEKTAEVRLTGLDDSVLAEDIVKAVVTLGCQASQVRVSAIRPGAGGAGVARISCPVGIAKMITDAGRLLVGWVSARAHLLEARKPRCYRCLQEDHVGAKCPEKVDCSGLCFRCGQPGHKAADCGAEPSCPLCKAAGKDARHRVGSKSCSPPKSKRKGGQRTINSVAPPAAETPRVAPLVEAMEVTNK